MNNPIPRDALEDSGAELGAISETAQRHRRERWRALLLCVKAKLESVSSKIETFEEAFLAHVVMPDGRTVHEHTAPRIAEIAKGGELKPLLPGPMGGTSK
jgi:hypothetical protein